jgi:hypothetical protein
MSFSTFEIMPVRLTPTGPSGFNTACLYTTFSAARPGRGRDAPPEQWTSAGVLNITTSRG